MERSPLEPHTNSFFQQWNNPSNSNIKKGYFTLFYISHPSYSFRPFNQMMSQRYNCLSFFLSIWKGYFWKRKHLLYTSYQLLIGRFDIQVFGRHSFFMWYDDIRLLHAMIEGKKEKTFFFNFLYLFWFGLNFHKFYEPSLLLLQNVICVSHNLCYTTCPIYLSCDYPLLLS